MRIRVPSKPGTTAHVVVRREDLVRLASARDVSAGRTTVSLVANGDRSVLIEHTGPVGLAWAKAVRWDTMSPDRPDGPFWQQGRHFWRQGSFRVLRQWTTEGRLCGQPRGYWRHRRANETACQPCIDAKRRQAQRAEDARKEMAS